MADTSGRLCAQTRRNTDIAAREYHARQGMRSMTAARRRRNNCHAIRNRADGSFDDLESLLEEQQPERSLR